MPGKFKITKVVAREILDSRGNPTVEATVWAGKASGTAAVPSGASTGTHEALELRDGDMKRYSGLGVLKALSNVERLIAPKVKGHDPRKQAEIDQIMIKLDGTPNKAKLGANAILAVSLATAKLASVLDDKPLYSYLSKGKGRTLPAPVMNVINGGKHAGTGLKIQEFMIIPSGIKNFTEALRAGAEVYHTLKRVIQTKHGKLAINVGDEGGFAPPLNQTSDALELLMQAIAEAGYSAGKELFVGFDAASSEFYNTDHYEIDGENKTPEQLTDFYSSLVDRFPIRYIEDPFEEEAYESTAALTKKIGDRVEIVGDDIFVTNVTRLEKGIKMGAANALLLKVNQIGSLTESIEAASLAKKNKYGVVTSHRSGETSDTTIADLAVALGAGHIKTGAPCRSERTAKYNRLLAIEKELGKRAVYAGPTLAH
ncbi:MAG TPA: phosphopyruvate hydratase [Candidatus Acidoferrales bacterium]|nr:phosphopyruvate hydratase [Candidatus Acidoferrales bacterium]